MEVLFWKIVLLLCPILVLVFGGYEIYRILKKRPEIKSDGKISYPTQTDIFDRIGRFLKFIIIIVCLIVVAAIIKWAFIMLF